MNRKLTLSLDESILETAKNYYQKKNESLSQIVEKIVENYLKIVTSESTTQEFEIAPLVKELIGSITDPSNINVEDVEFSKNI
jgi:uncharacterized membrane protein